MWSGLFSRGKELTLKICFNYVDGRHSSASAGRKVEKWRKSSVARRMIDERDAQLDAEKAAFGQKPIWRSAYNLLRCVRSTCPSTPYCLVDPTAKKHYQLKTHHLRRLVSCVKKGACLDGHKDVPETIRE